MINLNQCHALNFNSFHTITSTFLCYLHDGSHVAYNLSQKHGFLVMIQDFLVSIPLAGATCIVQTTMSTLSLQAIRIQKVRLIAHAIQKLIQLIETHKSLRRQTSMNANLWVLRINALRSVTSPHYYQRHTCSNFFHPHGPQYNRMSHNYRTN